MSDPSITSRPNVTFDARPNNVGMTDYTEILKYVSPELPGAPVPLIMQTTQRIAREFCEKTYAWLYQIEPLDILEGKTEYEFDEEMWPQCKAEIHRIVEISLVLEDRILVPEVDYRVNINNSSIELTREPQRTERRNLRVRLALKPKRRGTAIDSHVFDTWLEALVAGVLWYMHRMPDKTWSDMNLAMVQRARYWALRNEAKSVWFRGGGVAQLGVKSRGRASFVVQGRTGKRRAAV